MNYFDDNVAADVDAVVHAREKIRLALQRREGGHTERCHVIPHHGSYSVANHSWHAAMLLVTLHPNPSMALLKAILTHDIQERWTGDLPASLKMESIDLNDICDACDRQVRTKLSLPNLDLALTSDERQWLLAVDRLELMLWCADQRNMGNHHHEQIEKNLNTWCQKCWVEIPIEIREFIRYFQWERTPDHI